MFNKLLITTALVCAAGSAMAADVGGEITTEIAENAAGNWGATTSFDLGIASMGTAVPAFAAIDLDMNTDGDITLDEWQIGTVVNGDAMISFGDQGNVWIDSEDGSTLADPAMKESIAVKALGAKMGISWKDIEADVTEIETVAGMYEMNLGLVNLQAAGSYNMVTENFAIGSRSDYLLNDNIVLGAAITYDSGSEDIGFEVDAGAYGATVFVNGDQDEMLQNVGGSYTYGFIGLELEAGASYNLDSEELTPTASVSFSF